MPASASTPAHHAKENQKNVFIEGENTQLVSEVGGNSELTE